jgi:hypothetical protein
MGAIISADVSINAAGDIRWTGERTKNRHSILEFIQFLMDKQDDEQAVGDDLLDITVDTPFDRSTDQIVTLNSPFNIDDAFAKHLYDGSVSQTEPSIGGETVYSGLRVLGPVEIGTEYMIVQDGKVLPSFWGTGINAEESPSLVFSRHLVKTKYAGTKIDGQRITVLARELGDQYRRFPATLGTGNGVAAIGNGADIFNTTSDADLASYTTVTNIEGFQEINIDGSGALGQEYYSQWDIGAQTVNQTYERTKWISQRSHTADSIAGNNPSFGEDYIIDDGSILGMGTEFSATSSGEILTGTQLSVRVRNGTPTGTLYCELFLSDDADIAAPRESAIATSEPILATELTSAFEDVLFQFNRVNPTDGSDQTSGLSLLPSREYFIVIRHADGSAANNFSIEGFSITGGEDGNLARDIGGTWTGFSGEALNFEIYTSPEIHGLPGQVFQGINVEVSYDDERGYVDENDIAMWGTEIVYGTLADGPFLSGEYITIKNGGDIVSGATVLYDDGVSQLIVALDTPGVAVIVDTDAITTLRGGGATETTALIDTTVVNEDKGGGTGLIIAKDDNGQTGEIYLQVLSGVNPVNNSRIYGDNDPSDAPLASYVTATAIINTKTVSPEFLGTSTGSNIIGSYGVGFEPSDVGASDRFEDLSGTARTPPNNVTFTVSGITTEDRVLVGPRLITSLDRSQWLMDGLLSGAAIESITVKTGTDTVPWPTGAGINEINWPTSSSAGSANSALRIELVSGIYKRLDYLSHDSASVFTVAPTDFSGDNAADGADVFLAFIDVLSGGASVTFTGVHGGVDRDLFVRVRDGGETPIKTFEATAAVFGSTDATVAAIRTPDI